MFNHLYQGSPPWIFAALLVALFIHVGAGGVAIVSGAGALAARKGEPAHRRFGMMFVVAMIVMSLAASVMALVAVARGHAGQIANVFAGPFAFYLVATGWLAVRRAQGVTGLAEVWAFVGALIIAAVALLWLLPITLGPEGRALGVPIAAPIILAAIAALLAALDLKVIRQGGVTGHARVQRHLWRMCLGLFFATGSFFIGQQADMPAVVRGSPALLLLGLSPMFAMAFWLVRTRLGVARPAPGVLIGPELLEKR